MFALIAIVVLLAAAFFCVYRAGQYSVDIAASVKAEMHEANVSAWEADFVRGCEFAVRNYEYLVEQGFAGDNAYGWDAGIEHTLRHAQYLGLSNDYSI